MKDDSTTYDITTGRVVNPLEEKPVIIIRKGKRKINPLFEELLKSVPQEVKDRVEKVMTCKWLRNGDECGKGLPRTPCELEGCVAWEYYKEEKKDD